ARQGAGGDHPLGRAVVGLRRGCAARRPRAVRGRVPVLGICYGFQAMADALGGTVAQTGTREYGGTEVEVAAEGVLLKGSPPDQTTWMSHGAAVQAAPEGFEVLATSPGSPVAAFED